MVKAFFGSNMFNQYRCGLSMIFHNGKSTLGFLLFFNDATAVSKGSEWVKLGRGIRD